MKEKKTKKSNVLRIKKPIKFKRVLVENTDTGERFYSLAMPLIRNTNDLFQLRYKDDSLLNKEHNKNKIIKIEEFDYKETATDIDIKNHITELVWLMENNVKFVCYDKEYVKDFEKWYISNILNNDEDFYCKYTNRKIGFFFLGWKDLYIDSRGMLKLSKDLRNRIKKYLSNKVFIRNKRTKMIICEDHLPYRLWRCPEKVKREDIDISLFGMIRARKIFEELGFMELRLNDDPIEQFVVQGIRVKDRHFPMKEYSEFDKWIQCQLEAVVYNNKGEIKTIYQNRRTKNTMSWFEMIDYSHKNPGLPPLPNED